MLPLGQDAVAAIQKPPTEHLERDVIKTGQNQVETFAILLVKAYSMKVI